MPPPSEKRWMASRSAARSRGRPPFRPVSPTGPVLFGIRNTVFQIEHQAVGAALVGLLQEARHIHRHGQNRAQHHLCVSVPATLSGEQTRVVCFGLPPGLPLFGMFWHSAHSRIWAVPAWIRAGPRPRKRLGSPDGNPNLRSPRTRSKAAHSSGGPSPPGIGPGRRRSTARQTASR